MVFHEAGFKENELSSWIKTLEDDTYKYAEFLRINILWLKNAFTTFNQEDLKIEITAIVDNLKNNYVLIERHYILLRLFSWITLKLLHFSKKKILKK